MREKVKEWYRSMVCIARRNQKFSEASAKRIVKAIYKTFLDLDISGQNRIFWKINNLMRWRGLLRRVSWVLAAGCLTRSLECSRTTRYFGVVRFIFKFFFSFFIYLGSTSSAGHGLASPILAWSWSGSTIQVEDGSILVRAVISGVNN